MKLPFTEKFLWDLYKFLKLTGDALNEIASMSSHSFFTRIGRWSYPNYLGIKKREENKLGKERVVRLIKYLKYNGYLYVQKDKNKNAIILTPKGAEKILEIKRKIKGPTLTKRKDGKWQMVIFDIPEDIRKRRDYFRAGLKRLKYQQLQQSIWICPYDVLKDTQELIKYFKLGSFVRLLLIEEIKI